MLNIVIIYKGWNSSSAV